MKNTQAATRLALALATAAILAGCATPARVEQMQVDSSMAVRTAAASSPLKDNVAIKDTTGGKDTNPAWVSNIGSIEFERSIEASLRNVGLLSANRQGGKYQLTTHLLKVDQPMFGASMTVTTTVQYTLTERATGKEVLAKTLVTPYTAPWDAAFLGSERLKLANEGSARASIQALLDALLALKVDGVELRKP